MKRLRATLLSLSVLAMILLPAGNASAVPPEIFHVNFDETFEEELCGIFVMGHAQGVDTFRIFFDQEGNEIRVLGSGQGMITWTNPENGKSVSLSFAGNFRETAVENPDGTVTFTSTVAGRPENIFVPPHESLVKDVGRVTFVTTVDFGDPGDPEDDVVVSFEIAFLAGPHPELESDFTLFCEVITAALT
jgi:hypothetical protein